MRFVVCGGGTGGHIYPALSIARGLQQKFPTAEVYYLGGTYGLEKEIVPRSGLPFLAVEVRGLERRLTAANIGVALRTLRGLAQAVVLLRRLRPRVVIGTGGYVCGPIILAAAVLRIPTVIHEQNAMPGLTNRLLARWATRIALTFAEAAAHLPSGARKKAVLTGLPVRMEISEAVAVREELRQKMGIKPHERLVLSFGGSQGSRRLNQAVAEMLQLVKLPPHVHLLHVTGTRLVQEFQVYCQQLGLNLAQAGNITITDYLYDMPSYLAAADLAVCRAGASTIAELLVAGVPAILIPYPYATANHQEHNARSLVKRGAAEMILDRELNGHTLAHHLLFLIADENRRRQMAEAAKAMAEPQALEKILNLISELLG